MTSACGLILADASFTDTKGCVLPVGHDGPHECRDEHGRAWNWEADLECDCEHCRQCDGDYCTIYWQKK